jgi:hypothetical protein
MSAGACKIAIDGGNHNGSAQHLISTVETFVQVFLLAEKGMSKEGIDAAVEFSQEFCDWHEAMDRWRAKTQKWIEDIHAGAYDKGKAASDDDDDDANGTPIALAPPDQAG